MRVRAGYDYYSGDGIRVLTAGIWYDIRRHTIDYVYVRVDNGAEVGIFWDRFDLLEDNNGIKTPNPKFKLRLINGSLNGFTEYSKRGGRMSGRIAGSGLDAECWIDKAERNRGVDFMAAVRASAEATRRKE